MSDDSLRGTGQTSTQMRNAPHGALFVWCNGHLQYPKALATRLKRHNLIIVGPADIIGHRQEGKLYPAVVVDHAARGVVRAERGDAGWADFGRGLSRLRVSIVA